MAFGLGGVGEDVWNTIRWVQHHPADAAPTRWTWKAGPSSTQSDDSSLVPQSGSRASSCTLICTWPAGTQAFPILSWLSATGTAFPVNQEITEQIITRAITYQGADLSTTCMGSLLTVEFPNDPQTFVHFFCRGQQRKTVHAFKIMTLRPIKYIIINLLRQANYIKIKM